MCPNFQDENIDNGNIAGLVLLKYQQKYQYHQKLIKKI